MGSHGSTVDSQGLDHFSTFVHGISSSFWLSMVFGGFVSPKGGPLANTVWQGLFLAAMTICGATCLSNVIVRDPPYHMLPADVMVAFVHFPGFYSIFFWSRCLSRTDGAIWLVIRDSEIMLSKLKVAVRTLGPFLIPAQIATVMLVYAGYAVPAQLFVNKDSTHMLTNIHNAAMWIVIPPVVSCVVANAAFFSFFVYVMYCQVDAAHHKMQMREQVLLDGEADNRVTTPSADGDLELVSTMKTEYTAAFLKTHDYDGFMEVLADDIFAIQDLIDDVCQVWSPLVALFISVAFAEILAVLYDFILVYSHAMAFELTIWVYCIDAFLVVSGLGIVTGFLAMGAVLTQRMDELCIEGVQVMRAGNVPISKAASTFYYLQTGGRKTGLGFKIYGIRIEWAHVCGFLSGVLTVVGFIMSSVSPQSTAMNAGRHHRHIAAVIKGMHR